MGKEAFIYDAVRTPRGRGKAGGSLHEVKPVQLASSVLQALSERNGLDTAFVDDVILGCVSPVAEQGGNIAKTAVQNAGWDQSVPGMQLDRFCASGLEAVNLAAMKVASGWEELVVAGGIESMSRVPLGSAGGAWANDPEFILKLRSMHQGVSADLLATVDGRSREDVDAVALASQRRASVAQSAGWYEKSLVPVRDELGLIILDHDELLRPETSLEGLAGLEPSFARLAEQGYDSFAIEQYPFLDGIRYVHTAGNSSGIVDGASAVLIGSGEIGRKLGLQPRARIVATAVISSEPVLMLAGPGPAAKKCLDKAGLKVGDIDLFEINEAFASVVLRFMDDLGISLEVTNVNGGAIALGHPLGATGGMLVGTMVDELERRDLRRALITLCAGGGIGIATIIERL